MKIVVSGYIYYLIYRTKLFNTDYQPPCIYPSVWSRFEEHKRYAGRTQVVVGMEETPPTTVTWDNPHSTPDTYVSWDITMSP